MLNLEIIRSEADWDNLAEEWNQLLPGSVSNVPFLRYEFLSSWWQHRGGGEWTEAESLYILAARDEHGALAGALPLFISKNHAGERALILLGSMEIADFLDVLVRPDQLDPFLDIALAHLVSAEAPDWASIELYNLLEDSSSLPALQNAADKVGLKFSSERLQPAPLISLPDDFDTYLESLDSRYRRELTRKMRNAMGYFIPVSVEKVEDDLPAAMEDFFSMMREEAHKEAFLTKKMEAQMQALAAGALENVWLDLRFLIVGRDRAAGYLNFIYDNRMWVYNSAKAEKFAALSPGISLMGLLVQEAIEQGIVEFDLMRGDEGYKYQLGGVDRWVVKAAIKC